MALHYPDSDWTSCLLPDEHSVLSAHTQRSIFDNPRSQVSGTNTMAILLTLHPHHSALSLHDASVLLGLHDLIPAVGDFFSDQTYSTRNGRRVSSVNCYLPFRTVDIWEKLRIQQRSMQDAHFLAPAQTVQAIPPSDVLPFGRANTVLISHESGDLLSIQSEHV